MAIEKLKNGATVLRRINDVVLCDWNDEYVTWRTDTTGNAYWGHYHTTLEKACAEFVSRAAAQH